MRVLNNKFVQSFPEKHPDEMKDMVQRGTMPIPQLLKKMKRQGVEIDQEMDSQVRPILIGQVAGVIDSIRPAKDIIYDMVNEAVEQLMKSNQILTRERARL